MPAECIKAVLDLDYIDTTAAAVAAAYPDSYASAGEVPVYAYQSLATLLGVASSVLPSRVVANYGEAKTRSDASIVIQTTEILESVDVPKCIQSDYPGAEFASVEIFTKTVRTTTDVSLMKNLQFRIRYLIDNTLRQQRPGTDGFIPVEDDLSIKNQYIFCIWEANRLLTASEWTAIYRVEYCRSFPVGY